MGFTLEAIIIIPLTMTITIGILNSTAQLYKRIETDSVSESKSVYYTMQNREIWSTKESVSNKGYSWSKSTAVNPVKIKQTVELIIDTTKLIGDSIPLLKDIKGAVLNDIKK
jgi:hypothetical protein